MVEPTLTVEGLTKSFGGVVATNQLDFEIKPGEIHAIIGPNGAGKTCLLYTSPSPRDLSTSRMPSSA